MYNPTSRPPSPLMRVLIRPQMYRHPHRGWAAVCFAVSVWLVILASILLSAGFWWAAPLVAVAALEARIGYSLLHGGRTHR